MKSTRIKSFFMPVIYGCCAICFLFSMYFLQRYANDVMFSDEENLEYVDNEITENNTNDIPVVSTTITIARPYVDASVSIGKTFYDYTATKEEQEGSIVYYEGTYMQNSGVDYTSDTVFDVVSILDGTVTKLYDNDILGTTIEIKHSNNLISVYQSLSDVLVEENMVVVQGQVLAKSGTSNINKDLGNHLHFELYHNGKIVNPEEYYNRNVDEF